MYNHVYLDEGLKRWIYRTAHRNYWRVSRWYDLDDLIQDGFLCYQKCAHKYRRLQRKRKPRKDDRRNFMALVKRAYENHIHDLASKRTVQKEYAVSRLLPISTDLHHDQWLEQYGGHTEPAEFLLYFNELQPKVRKVLIEAFRDVLQGKQPDVAELNAKLNKAVGSKNSVDMVSRMYKHFGVVRSKQRA